MRIDKSVVAVFGKGAIVVFLLFLSVQFIYAQCIDSDGTASFDYGALQEGGMVYDGRIFRQYQCTGTTLDCLDMLSTDYDYVLGEAPAEQTPDIVYTHDPDGDGIFITALWYGGTLYECEGEEMCESEGFVNNPTRYGLPSDFVPIIGVVHDHDHDGATYAVLFSETEAYVCDVTGCLDRVGDQHHYYYDEIGFPDDFRPAGFYFNYQTLDTYFYDIEGNTYFYLYGDNTYYKSGFTPFPQRFNSYALRGFVDDGSGEKWDICTGNQGVLKEYYCDGNTLRSEDINCSEYFGEGSVCNNGQCTCTKTSCEYDNPCAFDGFSACGANCERDTDGMEISLGPGEETYTCVNGYPNGWSEWYPTCYGYCEGSTRYYNGVYDPETETCLYESEECEFGCNRDRKFSKEVACFDSSSTCDCGEKIGNIYYPEYCPCDIPANGNVLSNQRNLKYCEMLNGKYCDVYESGNGFMDVSGVGVPTYKDISVLNPFYAPGISDGSLRSQACCPKDYCWDGERCVEPGRFVDQYETGPAFESVNSCGYRCIANESNDDSVGKWILTCKKSNWADQESGYCNYHSQCFVSTSASSPCVDSGAYVGDEGIGSREGGNHFCLGGTWTTRTSMVALKLLSMMDDEAVESYSIYCDTTGNVSLVDPEMNIENLCVLQYFTSLGEKKVLAGLIMDTDEDLGVVTSTLGLGACNVPSVGINRSSWVSCEDSGGKLWYNYDLNSLIYNKDEVLTIEPTTWWDTLVNLLLNPLQALMDAFAEFFDEDVNLANYVPFISEGTNIQALFIQVHDGKSIIAYKEDKFDPNPLDGSLKTFLFLNYTGFDDQVCVSVNRTQNSPGWPGFIDFGDTALPPESTECFTVGSGYFVYDLDKDSEFTRFWQYLTSGTRVHHELLTELSSGVTPP